jgi:hypothetical protein
MTKHRRKFKVVERRLGKEKAWGQCTPAEGLIELDTRLSARRHCEVLLHEALHLAFPDMGEKEVDRAGKLLRDVIWSQNYRRVLLQPNAKPPRIS